MLSIAASLLGIGKWIRQAISGLIRLVVRYPWQAALIVSLAACAALWRANDRHKDERDKALAEIEEMTRLSKAADKRYRATEKQLADHAKAIEKDKNDAIAAITADRDHILERLRSRPSRPSASTPAVAANGQAASGCTGAQLYRDDASFLVRQAALADETRISLKACYAQYDDAREKMQVLQDATPVNP